MSLFPAYATDSDAKHILSDDSLSTDVRYEVPKYIAEMSECQLLASSDDEHSRESSGKEQQNRKVRDRSPLKAESCDFYIDTKLDRGNLRVSTLYYPGRPEYRARPLFSDRPPPRPCRYFDSPAELGDDAREASDRVVAFRRALKDSPTDVQLWIKFIHFQERCVGGPAAHRTATEACSAAPRSAALRELRLDLARRHLPNEQHLTELRDMLAKGLFLQSAGLWEQLTQLLELALTMSLPPAPGFPPPPDPLDDEKQEALLVAEEAIVNSGLPANAIWSRVERLRAARNWRVSADHAAASADPQRAPAAADLAPLLLPVADGDAVFLLLVEALRLVKVPLMPAASHVRLAVDGPSSQALATGVTSCGSALLALRRAARRVSGRYDSIALAAWLQPPNCLQHSDFLSWVESLWAAALSWTSAKHRAALLGWRLRWLHALMLLIDNQEESGRSELRRLRSQARQLLKRHADSSALPFIQFARLELSAAGAAAARAVLVTALRRDQNAPVVERLYGARVLRELSEAGSSAARWALCCAVLGRALPATDEMAKAPAEEMWRLAADHCEEQCAEIESSFSSSEPESPCAALLPSFSEWASARVVLSSTSRRTQLMSELLARDLASDDVTPRERRWRESEACALASVRLHAARELAPLFPDNAFLNIAAASGVGPTIGGAPLTDTAALARALPAILRVPPTMYTEQEAERVYRITTRAGALGAGGPLLSLVRLEASARAPRPAPRAVLYQALHADPHCKALHVAGALWASEWRSLADSLLERGLRLHALPDELQPLAPPPPSLGDDNDAI